MDPELRRSQVFHEVAMTVGAGGLFLSIFRLVHIRVVRGWWALEEYMVLCATVGLLLTTATSSFAIMSGFGKHEKDFDNHEGNLHQALAYFFFVQLSYKVTLGFNKLAFLMFYHHVFSVKTFQRVCKTSIAVVILGTLSFVVATIFQCVPIRKSRDTQVHGHCIDHSPFGWSWASFNTFTDLFIVFMPIRRVQLLQVKRAKKIGFAVFFSLGIFTCVVSAIRMKELVKSTDTDDDSTFTSEPALLWSVIEAAMGLICCNIPYTASTFLRCIRRA
ncbi:MAG: hypothetical protein M1822_006330 [Bathelium mastoideum]|nr:MAG: hypothetical protein M1822_006330 [Bathelium mastoideum]